MRLLELSAYVMLIVLVSFYLLADWISSLCSKEPGKYQICGMFNNVVKNESGTENVRADENAWLFGDAAETSSRRA